MKKSLSAFFALALGCGPVHSEELEDMDQTTSTDIDTPAEAFLACLDNELSAFDMKQWKLDNRDTEVETTYCKGASLCATAKVEFSDEPQTLIEVLPPASPNENAIRSSINKCAAAAFDF